MSIGGQIPGLEVLISDSVDISEYTDFELYDLIWYWDKPQAIYNPCIGRWLGVYHRVRSELCYWILIDKGTVLYCMKVQHMTIDEAKDSNISEKVKEYKDTLDGNLRNPKYIYTESDFDGFIMHEYLPHQRDELPTNKWEE